ncbi:MAG: hypothetical protein MW689_000611 [Thermodesulfobacteria bacterium]|nr:hypothetical protein [Thermodesulfobacteriota bacterium]
MDFKYLNRLLKDYKKMKKFFIYKGTVPAVREIREMGAVPPLYVLIVEETYSNLFKCIPLTELGILVPYEAVPIFNFKDIPLSLCCLPFWIYLSKEILIKFSRVIAKTNEESISRCLEFVSKVKIPEKGIFAEYINFEMERLRDLNTYSMLSFVEEIEREPIQIVVEDELKEFYKREYAYLLAASPKKVLKGKNWYGIIKEKEGNPYLVLYLPADFIGKEIKVILKDKVLYKGKIFLDKLILENIPKLSDYSFLEEELDVQI